MKITNKENLCKYLQENLINDDRAEVFSEVICIQSNEDFKKIMRECKREYEELGDDALTFRYDSNIYSLVEDLCLLDDETILNNFGSLCSNTQLAVNEDGEGFVFFEVLW